MVNESAWQKLYGPRGGTGGGSPLIDLLKGSEQSRITQRLKEAGTPTPNYLGRLSPAVQEAQALYAKQAPAQAAPQGQPSSRLQQMIDYDEKAIAELRKAAGSDPEAWVSVAQAQQKSLENQQMLTELETSGSMSRADGSKVLRADLESSDPIVRSMAAAEFAQLGQKMFGDRKAMFQIAGLPVPDGLMGGEGSAARVDTNAQDAAIWESKSRQAEFDNRMAQYDAKIAFDQTNVARTAQDISRHTQGLAESRQRADLITDLQVRSAPYNTGGRTSFSGTDMGALTESLMRKAGFNNPQAITNLVNYPSNIEIDAPGLMAAADAQLGVQGQLPQMPSLVTRPGEIPGAPPITAFVPTQYIGGSSGYSGGFGAYPQQPGTPSPPQVNVGPTPGVTFAPPRQWEDNTPW